MPRINFLRIPLPLIMVAFSCIIFRRLQSTEQWMYFQISKRVTIMNYIPKVTIISDDVWFFTFLVGVNAINYPPYG